MTAAAAFVHGRCGGKQVTYPAPDRLMFQSQAIIVAYSWSSAG